MLTIVSRRARAVLGALAPLALMTAGCAAPDPFEHGKVLLDAPDLRVVVVSSGYADTVNYGGLKAEALGAARIATLELNLFYDRNDNGKLEQAESIGHWSNDSRSQPSATVLLLPPSGEGFKNTGIPVQRLLYQVDVTMADGSTRTGTLRANQK